MSEEQTKAVTPEATTPTEAPKVEVEKAKEMTFNQAQLDNIIKSRLDAEKSKHQRQLDEVKKQDDEALKEKAVKEAKSKAELEKLMQQRILEKDTEINKFKVKLKKNVLIILYYLLHLNTKLLVQHKSFLYLKMRLN